MKTSNKLLLGALALIIVGIIAVNIALKQEVNAFHEKQGVKMMMEENDTTTNDSVSIKINL